MDGLMQGLEWALGLHAEPKDFTLLQISLRTPLTYLFGLAILRLSRNRFLARESAFDVLLAFMLGSVLSRAINGTTPLLLSLAASFLLIAIHYAFAWLSYRSPLFERFLDGQPDPVLRGGRLIRETLRRHRLSHGNLEEALRLEMHAKDLAHIDEAWIENNGEISFIPRQPPPPRIVEVKVEDGIQVVRLEIS